jgi:hypothetical protein
MKSSMFLLSLTLSCGAAMGVECKIFVDQRDFYSFGRGSLGASKESLLNIRSKSKECVENLDGSYSDCEYTDSNGVSYLVEGKTIIRKEIRDLRIYQGRLIGGISSGDGLISVLKKLSSLPPEFPIWSVGFESNGGFILGTGTCIQARNGVEWSYNIYFDRSGSVRAVGAQLNWN